MTSAIITILLFVCLLAFEMARKNEIPIDSLRMTLAIFAMEYFLIPELLPASYACDPFCDGVPWLPRIVAVVGLFALVSGFFLSHCLPTFKVTRRAVPSERSEYHFVLFVLLLSFLALYTYASSFGGFISAFSYGAVARYTSVKVEVQGSAVAMHFVGMVYVVLVISQYKLYQESKYKSTYLFVLLGAIIVVLSYSLISASRGAIFNVAMLMLFLHLNAKGLNITFKKLAVFALVFVFGALLTIYGKRVIGSTASFIRDDSSTSYSAVEKKEIADIYGRIILEFSHPIKSLGIVLERDLDYNCMKHFFVAPLHLIPSRLLGLSSVKPFRITETNTYLLTGDPEGGIPPGLVASFWYGGGVLGVLIGCLSFGGFIGWLQSQCYVFVRAYPNSMPVVLYIFFRLAWFINNGDLSVFLKHNFHVFILLIVLIVYSVARRIGLSYYRFEGCSKPSKM